MGNTHSSAFVSRTVGALDTYVAELGPDVSYDKRCVHLNTRTSWRVYLTSTAWGRLVS